MSDFRKQVKAQVAAVPLPEPNTAQIAIARDFEQWFGLAEGEVDPLRVYYYGDGHYRPRKVNLKHKGVKFKSEWTANRYQQSSRRKGPWRARTLFGYRDTVQVAE